MINIAILDDNNSFLDILEKKIQDYFIDKKYQFHIDKFFNLKSINEMINNKRYDIFIMDINMDGNGTTSIPFGNKINNINKDSQIIFITAYPNYLPDVYECNHVYCVLKDELNNRLNDALDKALNKIFDKSYNTITLKTSRTTTILNINNIIFLEKSLRKIVFYLKDGQIFETYATFDDYAQEFPDCFKRVHRSYIINTNYIKSINSNSATMLNNKIVPISKTYSKDVMDSFLSNYF